jgi:hypothetical protein
MHDGNTHLSPPHCTQIFQKMEALFTSKSLRQVKQKNPEIFLSFASAWRPQPYKKNVEKQNTH